MGVGDSPDPICVRLGENLRRMRSLAGLSQAEVGRRLGVTFQQVQKYERGTNNVTVPMLFRLKAALACELTDLLAGLDRIPVAGAAASPEGGRQRMTRRLVKAVLAIDDADVQEGLIRLARSLAADSGGVDD